MQTLKLQADPPSRKKKTKKKTNLYKEGTLRIAQCLSFRLQPGKSRSSALSGKTGLSPPHPPELGEERGPWSHCALGIGEGRAGPFDSSTAGVECNYCRNSNWPLSLLGPPRERRAEKTVICHFGPDFILLLSRAALLHFDWVILRQHGQALPQIGGWKCCSCTARAESVWSSKALRERSTLSVLRWNLQVSILPCTEREKTKDTYRNTA